MPIMIHRAILGSFERFIGILTEHVAGAFPLWLAPVQVKVLPIAEAHYEYAHELRDKLEARGIRVEVDDRNEKIGYKIREAQLEKIPYMFVIGEKEKENNQVAIRKRKDGDIGTMGADEVISMIVKEIEDKVL